jgi:hypothetical protein
MIREYRLTIQAIGHDEAEAIESAVRILNEGANFDEVTFLYETPEASDGRTDSSL